MIGKFFHTPRSRGFNIPYRFYDPDKEAMDERIDRIKYNLGLNEKKGWDVKDGYHPNLHGQFRRAQRGSSGGDAQRSSNIRLLIMIAILSLIFLFVLFY